MEDYGNYLAANILSDDRVITYRLLSRALKVNVNAAKEMLYEFHQRQNFKKPGTIHATYLISGTKPQESRATNEQQKDGEDEYMQSSPFMSSSMPQPTDETGETSVLSISLVREEDLESLKSQYGHISSIHIYSLGPHPLKDLQTLSDCTREVNVLTASEDPLEYYPKYGTVINPLVKRRTNRRPPPPPATAPVKPSPTLKSKPTESTKESSKPSSTSSTKQELKQQSTAARDFFGKGKDKAKSTGTSEPSSKEGTPAPNPPALKRDSSSIFKAFAKAKPKLKSEGTDSSAGAGDKVMTDAVHFDEDEEETYTPPVQDEENSENRASRKEREARLKAMMEDDEEEAPPAPQAEPEPVEEEETILEQEKLKEEPEHATTVSGGRRRGKRRVMQKKTATDDEGFLVTVEEPAWESFSEDEPVARPVKAKAPSASTSGPKGKKGPEKKGQGSIMSFFGKK